MKRFLALIVLLIGLVTLAATSAQDDVIAQAETAYRGGDYPTAVRLYEALVAGGARSGEMFYNLGAAYDQSGDLGRALVNYRRAQEWLPRDSDLNTAIARVRARRLDVQGDETGLLEGLSVLTSGVLTLQELGWLAYFLWVLWFALLSASLLLQSLRETLRAPFMILGILTLFSGLLLVSRVYVTAVQPSGVVIVSTVQVMSGPSSDYLEIFQLHEAAELRIQETRDTWARVSLPDGRHGWVPTTAFEVV